MNKLINKISLLAILILLSNSSFAQIFNNQKKTASYYSADTECVEDKLDGTFVLYAWGQGSSKSEAINQAKRNVLNDILFDGVRKGCQIRPLILELNGKKKHQSYTYAFFDKHYKKYISMENSPKTMKKSREKTSYRIKVRVKVEKIRQKLIEDNIIKQ